MPFYPSSKEGVIHLLQLYRQTERDTHDWCESRHYPYVITSLLVAASLHADCPPHVHPQINELCGPQVPHEKSVPFVAVS